MPKCEEELPWELDQGPVASVAFVIRMPIGQMAKVHEAIKAVDGAKIVFMKTSAARLEVVEVTRDASH